MPLIEAAGVQVNFPFDPYPCQVAYMEKMIQSLRLVSRAVCYTDKQGGERTTNIVTENQICPKIVLNANSMSKFQLPSRWLDLIFWICQVRVHPDLLVMAIW